MEIIRVMTDTNMECPICNENIHDIYTTSCCNQIIHKECLDKCLKTTKGCCPYCRNVEIQFITEIPEVNNIENNNNTNLEIRLIMCKCTICKVFIVNVIFILAVVSWLLSYQILANKRLLREYRCNKYPYCNVTNITNITNITG